MLPSLHQILKLNKQNISHSWVGKCRVKGHAVTSTRQHHIETGVTTVWLKYVICVHICHIKYCLDIKTVCSEKKNLIWPDTPSNFLHCALLAFIPSSHDYLCAISDTNTACRHVTQNRPDFPKKKMVPRWWCDRRLASPMDLKSIPGYSKVNLGAGRLCTSALVWEVGGRSEGKVEQRDANVALRWWLAFWGASVKKINNNLPLGRLLDICFLCRDKLVQILTFTLMLRSGHMGKYGKYKD